MVVCIPCTAVPAEQGEDMPDCYTARLHKLFMCKYCCGILLCGYFAVIYARASIQYPCSGDALSPGVSVVQAGTYLQQGLGARGRIVVILHEVR